jgi:hypothetical protein
VLPPLDLAALVRLDAAGDPRPGFGAGGLANVAGRRFAASGALALTADGHGVLVGGLRTDSRGGSRAAVKRESLRAVAPARPRPGRTVAVRRLGGVVRVRGSVAVAEATLRDRVTLPLQARYELTDEQALLLTPASTVGAAAGRAAISGRVGRTGDRGRAVVSGATVALHRSATRVAALDLRAGRCGRAATATVATRGPFAVTTTAFTLHTVAATRLRIAWPCGAPPRLTVLAGQLTRGPAPRPPRHFGPTVRG